MNNHALYCFAHFMQNYYTLSVGGSEMVYFADHFSPITIFYAPFYYLFGSYTLLLIQIIAILFGATGIYKLSKLYFNKFIIPILFLVYFLSIWGIYSALSFDFHNNVVAAMLVPWLFYYYKRDNKPGVIIFFVLILITKENMSLWLGFIMLALIVQNAKGKFKELLKFEIPLMIIAFAYFVIIVGVVMPYIREGQGQSQLARYSNLGSSIPEILSTFFKKPAYILSLFFKNTTDNPHLNGIKTELHLMVLISGGVALLFRPSYLIMLLPIYAQKMFTNNYGFWGINSQYSIEFVPIIAICLIDLLSNLKSTKNIIYIVSGVTLFTMTATIKTMERRKSTWYNKVNTAFYYGGHYKSNLNLKAIYKQINTLPEDAILSVSSPLSPHLAFRKKIYTFPNIKDAAYIVLFSADQGTYPLKKEDFITKVSTLKESDKFKVIYDDNDLLIFKRK